MYILAGLRWEKPHFLLYAKQQSRRPADKMFVYDINVCEKLGNMKYQLIMTVS